MVYVVVEIKSRRERRSCRASALLLWDGDQGCKYLFLTIACALFLITVMKNKMPFVDFTAPCIIISCVVPGPVQPPTTVPGTSKSSSSISTMKDT